MNVKKSYRYIVSAEGVRSGHPRIEGSRIGVHDIIGLLQNGETVDSVLRYYPALTRAQVYECLAYYEDHQAQVDRLIARQMQLPRLNVKFFLDNDVPDRIGFVLIEEGHECGGR